MLSPVGLVLSLVAIVRAPRGFAIAGLVIGLLGSVWAIIMLLIGGLSVVLAAFGLGAAVPLFVTEARMVHVATAVAEHKNPNGSFPTDLAALPGLSADDLKDAWGHALHIVLKAPNEFEIVSDGPDGIAGNRDDLHSNTTSTSDKPRHKRKRPAQVD